MNPLVRRHLISTLLLAAAAGCDGSALDMGRGPQTPVDQNTPVVPAEQQQPAPNQQPPAVDPGTPVLPGVGIPPPNVVSITDPLQELKRGDEQLAALCARGNKDPVSVKLCATPKPVITSLLDLQKTLGLAFVPGNNNNGANGNPAFALSGHSSSLVTRFTNAINPRAIIFTPPASNNRVNNPVANPNFIAMGFVRGEAFSELVAKDPVTQDLRFFLVRFDHACDANKSCSNADVLTPDVESNFTGVTVYQDVDIQNTIFDCNQCHQPGGPAAKKQLRMQELQNPWTHFFRNNRTGGQALIADYTAAHGAETYAGIPAGAIAASDPGRLEGLVENEGFRAQINEFRTGQIENEVAASGTVPGTSATWRGLYTQVMAGTVIPIPYHDVRVTDPTKLATATASYKGVMAGTTPKANLVDIRGLFIEGGLADMNFIPQPNLTGRQIMAQLCQHCHNATLDQTISRARFDVTKLDTMSRAEKDVAIARLLLTNGHADSRLLMPPARFATLPAAQLQLVVDELKK